MSEKTEKYEESEKAAFRVLKQYKDGIMTEDEALERILLIIDEMSK